MPAYRPLHISGMSTGLVQNRQEFILPNDAYPILENAYVWREQLLRKLGAQFLGRLTRKFSSISLGNSLASPWTFDILSSKGIRGVITNITNANPGQVTSPGHNLTNGERVLITLVNGMTQVNNTNFTITVVDADNFTIGVDTTTYGVYTSGGIWTLSNQPNASIQPGSVVIDVGGIIFTDQGNGTLTSTTPGNSGVINYVTGVVTLITTATAGTATTVTFNYFPGLPVMGLRSREQSNSAFPNTIAFDQIYAYIFQNGAWQEFIPGTTWSGNDANFFWSTNYWISNANLKLFWVTNFSGTAGDPIRYTDGVSWTNFSPQIDGTPTYLTQCLALLPFRNRLIAFNTFEGANLAASDNFPQRIRWSAIGSPLTTNAWRDDIPGQGDFLDIPTSENITAVGFVRDNLVVYCTSSTWQLRYTSRSIAPFQIERVNSELGAESLFSAIQFDTSLVGIGDKGIVECDSFKSERIDIKILDLVFNFNNDNQGPSRVQGVRDFINKLAYWMYPYVPSDVAGGEQPIIYPNRRLVYNYENDSWAIFTDYYTALGTYYPIGGKSWQDSNVTWEDAEFSWIQRPSLIPEIVGGNQQGFTLLLDSQTTNDPSLQITAITGNTTTPTIITSPNHNLEMNQVIAISGIPLGTPFANTLNYPLRGIITNATQANPCQITSASHNLSTGDLVQIDNIVGMIQLNGNVYTATVVDANNFTINVDSTHFTAYTSGGIWSKQFVNVFAIGYIDRNNFSLYKYNPTTQEFSTPQLDPPGDYVGGGVVSIRDNFYIQSKKFNNINEGQSIQVGYIDILLEATMRGAITLNVFANYNETDPVNVLPQNIVPYANAPDTFFNSCVPTTNPNSLDVMTNVTGTKYWHRVYCPVRANFLTFVWTLSNKQMAGLEQESDVEIDSQVLWTRPAGRMTNS